MKCPDKEQLMLYVDGELDSVNAAKVRAHLHDCDNCRHEAEVFLADLETESLLRKKVNTAFKKRSVSHKIMSAVMAEPRPTTVATSTNKSTKASLWTSWLIKLMVPALAIAITLFIVLGGSPSQQSPEIYRGNTYRISVLANNQNDCYVDGELYKNTRSFDVNAESFKKLEGSFLVNVVTPSEFYSVNIDGKTNLTFDLASMTPVFDDCEAKISIVNGAYASARINGKLFNITKDTPFELKKVEKKEIAKVLIATDTLIASEPIKPSVKLIEEEPIATNSEKIETNQNNDSEIIEEEIIESNDTEITGYGDIDNLTQGQIDVISIEELATGSISEEQVSPFIGR